MKNKCNTKLTIRSLIGSLTNLMEKSPNLTLDSEIVIADVNTLQEFEENIRVYVLADPYYNEDKIGIYLKQKAPMSIEEKLELVRQEVQEVPVKESRVESNQEPQELEVARNWWDKYK